MKIGDKVKYYRKLARLSQLQLELAINASTGTISRIENHLVNPTKETLFGIARALNLSRAEVAYLFGILEIEVFTSSSLSENF